MGKKQGKVQNQVAVTPEQLFQRFTKDVNHIQSGFNLAYDGLMESQALLQQKDAELAKKDEEISKLKEQIVSLKGMPATAKQDKIKIIKKKK